MLYSLYIKNMVCDRCRQAVTQVLDGLNIPYSNVELGEAKLPTPLTKSQTEALKEKLLLAGFELIEDSTARTISQIKNLILEWIRHPDAAQKMKLSVRLSNALHKDYGTLSSLFSSVEGITLEQYHILQKIERVKELLVYDELSLSQIADQLSYSSVQHLSNQFKKVTGLTPSHFKRIGAGRRIALDKL